MADFELSTITVEASKALAKEMDAHLIRFFGSKENLHREMHLWVLEVWPADIVMADHRNKSIEFQMETCYTLRMKTQEELNTDKRTLADNVADREKLDTEYFKKSEALTEEFNTLINEAAGHNVEKTQ